MPLRLVNVQKRCAISLATNNLQPNSATTTLLLGVGAYQVDVILRPQAMRHHRQRTVGVRREVNPNHVPWQSEHLADEARVLMRVAVVLLSPER